MTEYSKSLTRFDERLSTYASVFVPRNEINLMHKNSDDARHELSLKVEHVEQEVHGLKNDMSALREQITGATSQISNLKTSIRIYLAVGIALIAFVQPIVSKIITNYMGL